MVIKCNYILGVKLEVICKHGCRWWWWNDLARQRAVDRWCMAVSDLRLMLNILMPSASNVSQDIQGTDSHQRQNARDNEVTYYGHTLGSEPQNCVRKVGAKPFRSVEVSIDFLLRTKRNYMPFGRNVRLRMENASMPENPD